MSDNAAGNPVRTIRTKRCVTFPDADFWPIRVTNWMGRSFSRIVGHHEFELRARSGSRVSVRRIILSIGLAQIIGQVSGTPRGEAFELETAIAYPRPCGGAKCA